MLGDEDLQCTERFDRHAIFALKKYFIIVSMSIDDIMMNYDGQKKANFL
jgi:hypothetical protein